MSTELTPGDRACRYAYGAATVLHAYALAQKSDLAHGLYMLAEEAAALATTVIEETDGTDALEDLSVLASDNYLERSTTTIVSG